MPSEAEGYPPKDPGGRFFNPTPFKGWSLLGTSPRMLRIYDWFLRVSPSRATVLLLGESGTGKELLAGEIHRRSLYGAGRCLCINCAALPETLLEAELFGHAKGSHSMALADKPGLVDAANHGSLFLDEVSEASWSLQTKLLRFIESKTYRPVGGLQDRKADVRLIAASNKNLEELVRQGKFREDLFFRLNVVTITLPPLRERMEDLVILAHAFIAESANANGMPIPRLSPNALMLMQGYAWPGNVRELRNCIERMVVTSTGPVLDVRDLPESILRSSPRKPSGPHDLGSMASQRAVLEAALEANRGNVKATAIALNYDRVYLHQLIRKHGIKGHGRNGGGPKVLR